MIYYSKTLTCIKITQILEYILLIEISGRTDLYEDILYKYQRNCDQNLLIVRDGFMAAVTHTHLILVPQHRDGRAALATLAADCVTTFTAMVLRRKRQYIEYTCGDGQLRIKVMTFH